MKFRESQLQMIHRIQKEGPHPPLRTLKELAAEFKVNIHSVIGKLKLEGAPKPVLRVRTCNNASRACWYNPQEFRKWWRSINDLR